jgi:DedD protein
LAINQGFDERAQLQRRLVWRIAIAIALIVAAVIGLELLDRYAKPKPAPKRDVTVEVKPAPRTEAVAELPKPEAPKPETEAPPAPAPPEAPPPPVVESAPSTASPRADAKVGEAAEDAKPPVRSARAPEPAARPAAPVAPAAKPEVPPPPAAATPARAPASATAPPEPPAAKAVPGPAAGARGFAVQLGVFSAVENAQDLQARLKANGIPSYTETRVQVGPFKDRADAEKVRDKLRAMGMTPLIVPSN